MMRGGRTKSRTVGQRRTRGPVRGTRKNVRSAKRGAVIAGAAQARKRAAAPRRRRAAGAVMSTPQTKAARKPGQVTGTMPANMTRKTTGKTPRKARIGKR